MFTIDLILKFNGSQFHSENVNLLKSGLFFRPTHSRWHLLENSIINISIKSKSQAISTSFPQLILNIFSVKKLDNYIPACNHLAGQVLNVGDWSHVTPGWLLIGWMSLMIASYWSKVLNISHPGALLYHNKHAETEIKLISHQIISLQNF